MYLVSLALEKDLNTHTRIEAILELELLVGRYTHVNVRRQGDVNANNERNLYALSVSS